MSEISTVLRAEFDKRNLIPGVSFILILVVVAVLRGYLWAQPGECSLEDYPGAAFNAWENGEKLKNTQCYQMAFRNASDLAMSQEYAEKFEAEMARKYPVAGYKIGLHDPEIQEMIGLPDSMFGVFYGNDPFYSNGDVVKLNGQEFNYEPDLLMKVSSSEIMSATTLEQVVQYIDGIYAFIELPVLLGDPDEVQDGFTYSFLMQALNLGARTGVIGEYYSLDHDDPNLLETLRNMTVVSSNPDGTQRSIYHTNEEPVHWMITAVEAVEHMKRRGQELKAGDVISVGAMMEEFIDVPEPIEGKRHVHYYIGDDIISVTAGFQE
ncbi:hypothetical protein [Vibrio algarum]|uniref:Hydratase n=1 Tax=Vibrio algarum TaxID=3020714 RepID=A0ABT4YPF3_9VIBR|nr:hypothetical protein [Vibrio sp. KJ40-1]MDB1123425.1 hypothetical protein [Vibrio sp. KJ40-1]